MKDTPIVVLAALFIAVIPAEAYEEWRKTDVCPIWTTSQNATSKNISSKDGRCRCGNSLKGIVICNPKEGAISLTNCFCMTNGTGSPLVGPCLYTCLLKNTAHYMLKENITEDLDNSTCGP